MALTSALEISVKAWFDAISASGYTKYYSFADELKNFPLMACESADQQDYVELAGGTTALTAYNIVFAIADKVAANNQFAKLTTALTGNNNDLIFKAANYGDDGNLLSIKYNSVSAPEVFNISVSSTDYTINFTGATTAKDVMDYFNANYSTVFTVSNADGNDGTGYIAAMAKTNLVDGITNGEIYTKDKLQKKWEDIFETRSSGIKGVILAKEFTRTTRDCNNILHLYAAIKINK